MIKFYDRKIEINYKENMILDKNMNIFLTCLFSGYFSVMSSVALFEIFNLHPLYVFISIIILWFVLYNLFFTFFKNDYKKFLKKEISINEMDKIIDVLNPLDLPSEIKNKMQLPLTYSELFKIIPEINLYLKTRNDNAKKEKVENFFK